MCGPLAGKGVASLNEKNT